MPISIVLPATIFFAACSLADSTLPIDLLRSSVPTRSDYWKGINWKEAESGDCTATQLDVITTAMLDANKLATAAYASEAIYDGPFEDLFNSGWDKGGYRGYMAEIFANIKIARDYPQKGKTGSRPSPGNQLTIFCSEQDGNRRCSDPNRKVSAYVYNGDAETGPRMTLCSRFFDTTTRGSPKALSTIEKGRKSDNYIDLQNQGQAILHEYMHVDKFGYGFKIQDIKGRLQSTGGREISIYGVTNCREFAHINGYGNPNTKTAYNADNYAWWATGAYFTQQWKIKLQKRSLQIRDDSSTNSTQDDDDAPVLADDDYVVSDSTFDPPPPDPSNDTACHLDTSVPNQPKMICTDADEPTIAQSIGNGTDVTFANETFASTSITPAPTPEPIPSPSCLPAAEGGIDVNAAFTALGDFCTTQTGTVQKGSQPLSKTYDGGHELTIRLTLSWDDAAGNCPQSQSPNQNAGRDCNTIFHDIINKCPQDNPSFQNGGSITWQCGYYYLGFDQHMPDVAPSSTRAALSTSR